MANTPKKKADARSIRSYLTLSFVAATFILLPREGGEMNKKVIAFYDYAFKKGDENAKKLGYIPLPEETKKMIREYWAENLK